MLDLEQSFVGEGVYGSRKCVVDIEHEPSAEPLLQAGLKRVIDRVGVGTDGVRALVFVKTEQRARAVPPGSRIHRDRRRGRTPEAAS